jgi:hypothetical protein
MDYLTKIKSKKYPSNLFLDSKILEESAWAKPPLKSIVLTIIQKFVVLYNNYLFAAQFLALITIILFIFDKDLGVGHFTDSHFTDR